MHCDEAFCHARQDLFFFPLTTISARPSSGCGRVLVRIGQVAPGSCLPSDTSEGIPHFLLSAATFLFLGPPSPCQAGYTFIPPSFLDDRPVRTEFKCCSLKGKVVMPSLFFSFPPPLLHIPLSLFLFFPSSPHVSSPPPTWKL